MRTRLNDGRDLRRGAIVGSSPEDAIDRIERDREMQARREIANRMRIARGKAPKTYRPLAEVDEPGKVNRRRRGDYKPAVVEPKPRELPPIPLKPTQRGTEKRVDPTPTEWDNPYRKRKLSKGEALHYAALRRSREEAASDPENPVDRAAIIRRDDKTCWICRKRVEFKDIDLDHVVPLTRGGKHVPENLRVSCRSCNAWHGDRLVQPL